MAASKGVVSYLLLAFGIAWVASEIPLRLGISMHHPLFQVAMLPGGFALAIAAIIMRKRVTREGFADATASRPDRCSRTCLPESYSFGFGT